MHALLLIPLLFVTNQENNATNTEELSAITRMPKLITFVEATYPTKALEEKLEAEVTLELDVDAQGAIEAVRVAEASHLGVGFEEAALMAATHFVFEPAYAGEEAVPVRITYIYRFILAEEDLTPSKKQDALANFKGRILERGTRKPMAGLLVSIFHTRKDGEILAFETLTQADGRFVFYDLTPGNWNILVNPEGYFPVRTFDSIFRNQITNSTYYIERLSYNPFDVTVNAKRVRKEVNRTTLDIQEIQRVPGTFGDVMRVVQNLPSVALAPLGEGFVVRGSAPEDTSILLEGTPIPLIYHFGELRSVIPNGMLERIDFYPGNFPTYYSGATGGILDVGLKDLSTEDLSGYVDLNFWDSSAFVETPVGEDGALAVGYRRSYLDVLIGAAVRQFASEEAVDMIAAPRYWDGQILGQYRLAKGHELKLFWMRSDDRFEILFGDEDDEEQQELSYKLRFYRSLLEYKYIPSKTFENSLKISQGRTWADVIIFDAFRIDGEFDGVQIRDTLRWKLFDKVLLETGIDYGWQNNNSLVIAPPSEGGEGEPESTEPDPDPVADLVDQKTQSVGLFTALEIHPVKDLLLIPGLRFDYSQRLKTSKFAPRLTMRYNLLDDLVIKGGAGYFYQEPTFEEISTGRGNPNLGAEQAIHYALGTEFNLLERFTLDITGFYKELDNLVVSSEAVIERDGEYVPERYSNQGSGEIYGIETLTRHEFADNFFGWLSYTFSVSKRRDTPESKLRLFDYDQTHILTLIGFYKLPRNWEVGLRWRLISGNPTTPVTGTVVDTDWDYYVPTYGQVNTGRLPPFYQLDIRLDKRWIYDNWTLNFYVDIQNISNRSNPTSIAYSYDYSEESYSGGLPILPVLGLRGDF